MGLEIATYISGLNPSWPLADDPIREADDHMRLIKSTLKNTFPNITGVVNVTQGELNLLVGETSFPSVAGVNQQVQFNSAGNFAGSSNLTFDGTKLTAGALLVLGLTTIGLNDLSAEGIGRASSTGSIFVSGGPNQASGAHLTMYGSSHATVPGNVAFTIDSDDDLYLWNDAAGRHTFNKGAGASKDLAVQLDATSFIFNSDIISARSSVSGDPTAAGVTDVNIFFNSADQNNFGSIGFQNNDSFDIINAAYDADINIFATNSVSTSSDYGITLNSEAIEFKFDVAGLPEALMDFDSSGAAVVTDASISLYTYIKDYPLAGPGTDGYALAWNDANGRLELTAVGGGGGGTPGGVDTEIQFNNAGAFGGFGSWDGTSFELDTLEKISINSQAADVVNLTAGSGSVHIGNDLGIHIAFDRQNIQPKQNGTTAGTLNIANLGGTVQFGVAIDLTGFQVSVPNATFTGNINAGVGSALADQDVTINSAQNTHLFFDQSNVTRATIEYLISDSTLHIDNNNTGDVALGNFVFDSDQAVGVGQDNFVLTYDDGTGKISLEAAGGGGGTPGGADTQVQFNNAGSFGGSANFAWTGTDLDIDGRLLLSSATAQLPAVRFADTTQGVGEKNWDINLFNDEFSIRKLDDAFATPQYILTVSRGTGNVVDSVELGTDSDTTEILAATSVGVNAPELNLSGNTFKLGLSAGFSTNIFNNVNDKRIEIAGGNAASVGGEIHLFGGAAANAGDVKLLSSGNGFLNWDESLGQLDLAVGSGVKTAALTLQNNGDILVQNGIFTGKASETSQASFRAPHGVAPTVPVDGDIWTTIAGMFVRISGSTVGPLSAGGGGGGNELTVVTETTTTRAAAAWEAIMVDDDTAGSTVTINLPAGTTDTQILVKKLGTTANVIVDGNAAETIDGATTFTLTAQYAAVLLIWNGTEWSII